MSTVKMGTAKTGEKMSDLVDWERIDSLSDSDISQAVAEDPDAAPEMDARMAAAVLAQRARKATGLGQAAFARRFGLSVGTVRDWEQGRHQPDQAARALLKLIQAMPEATTEAMANLRDTNRTP